jgi:hypothetical protein
MTPQQTLTWMKHAVAALVEADKLDGARAVVAGMRLLEQQLVEVEAARERLRQQTDRADFWHGRAVARRSAAA